MQPFVDVSASPSYGKGRVVISWQVLPGNELAKYYVYRSPNGMHNWTLLNLNAPVTGTTMYLDTTVPLDEFHRIFSYRVLMVKGEDKYPSPVIGIHDRLTRSEYTAMFTMLRREWLNMRVGNGVRVFHYTPLTSGNPLPGYDQETGQNMALDGCEEGPQGHGTNFENGWGTPWQTWVILTQMGPMTEGIDKEGLGNPASQKIKTRMLALPRPRSGDLIVAPTTDTRYIIGDSIEPYLFKGIAPIAYDVELIVLDRTESHYKLEVPPLQPDGVVPMP